MSDACHIPHTPTQLEQIKSRLELRDPSLAAQHHKHKLREIMKAMKPEERVELWHSLQDGYCPHCGSEYMPCHCMNDE